MTDQFFRESSKTKTNKLQAYGDVLEWSQEVMWRLIELGVPTIWYTWLREPYIEEKGSGQAKSKRQVLGGPQLTGNFRGKLSGKAQQILLLEKIKTGGAGADPQGYVRQFRTRTYANIEAGGRFSQFLPDPCPAHLGYVLTQIMTRGQGQPQIAPAATP